ncbi:patatin-like phospholipase family protein [Flexithrix dorotheae]|uniref:patatin-like phospholipase family protein n=1 Tax=Flexithrix dorotheae TaxID=70993 RepID=UPI0003817E17|nr:patatin-like phospholipase family protein [Flexithrix dorotheae]
MKFRFFFFLILFFYAFGGISQNTKKPKVGLVLSGGGAKGVAHIGILKKLEELDLVPDIITGTSMGALVGGLYASGYSSEELVDIVDGINWDELLSNQTAWSHIVIEEKPYYGRYMLKLPVDEGKINVPAGIIEGQKLSELFNYLTRGVHNINDFEKLPISYSCVATDVVTGKEVILNKGSLAEAMRASMAIPSFFTPVVMEDYILVDGGLLKNFPVQEAIDMGADIIIGVNVGGGYYEKEELNNPVTILTQAAMFKSLADAEMTKKICHVFIEPDLHGYSTGSFTKEDCTGILERGVKAGEAFHQQLKSLSDSLKSLGRQPKTVQKPVLEDTVFIQKIKVIGHDHIPADYIKGKLRIAENSLLTYSEIEYRIDLLFGTQYFDKVNYEVKPYENGKELIIKVRESSEGNLKFSMFYDTEKNGGIITNLTLRNFLLPSSRFLFEASISENPQLDFNYLKYLGFEQNFAGSIGAFYQINEVDLYDNNLQNRLSVFSNQFLSGFIRIQTTSRKDFSTGIGIDYEYDVLKPKIGGEIIVDEETGTTIDVNSIKSIASREFNLSYFAAFNNMDDIFFPSRGWNLIGRIKGVPQTHTSLTFSDNFLNELPEEIREEIKEAGKNAFNAERYFQFYLNVHKNTPISKRLSFLKEGAILYSGNKEIGINDKYFVGGFASVSRKTFSLWGSKPYDFHLSNFLFLKLGLQYQMWKKFYLTGIGNAITTELVEPEAQPFANQTYTYGYGVGIGYKSKVGNLNFAISKGEIRKGIIAYFSAGFIY